MLNESVQEITKNISRLGVEEEVDSSFAEQEMTRKLSMLSISTTATDTLSFNVTPQHSSWFADHKILHDPGKRPLENISGVKLIELLPEDDGYKLVKNLFTKSQQSETDSLNYTRLSDFKISKVKLISNPEYEKSFVTEAKLLSKRRNEVTHGVFNYAISDQDPKAEIRKKVKQTFEDLTKDYKTDRCYFLPVWHGTKSEYLPSILKTGFANLAKTDVGYYGKGIYGSTNVEYVKRVYSDGYHKGILLLNWVVVYDAYPVAGIGDVDLLKGKGNKEGCDAHFIPVKPRNIFAHKFRKECTYFPLDNIEERVVYDELVVFNPRAMLARYIVEIERVVPKLEKAADYIRLARSLARDEKISLQRGDYDREKLLKKGIEEEEKEELEILLDNGNYTGEKEELKNELGLVLLDKKELREAEKLFLEVIENKGSSEAYFNLAQTLLLQKKPNIELTLPSRSPGKAKSLNSFSIEDLLKVAIESDRTKLKTEQNAKHYILLAKVNSRMHSSVNKGEIFEFLTKAIMLNPGLSEPYDLLGMLLCANEEITIPTDVCREEKLNAKKLFEKAIYLDESYYDAYIHLGELLLKDNKPNAKVKLAFPVDRELTARGLFEYAIEIKPNLALGYARLVYCLGYKEIVEFNQPKTKKFLQDKFNKNSLTAQEIGKLAVDLESNNPLSLLGLACSLREDESTTLYDQTRTNPRELCLKAYRIAVGQFPNELANYQVLAEILLVLSKTLCDGERLKLIDTESSLFDKPALLTKVIELRSDYREAVLMLSDFYLKNHRTDVKLAKNIKNLLKELLEQYYLNDSIILDHLGLWLDSVEKITIKESIFGKKELFEEAFRQEPTNKEIYGHLKSLGKVSVNDLINSLRGKSSQEIMLDPAMVQGIDLYVPVKTTEENINEIDTMPKDDELKDLKDYVNSFITNDETYNTLLLQGRAGSGKSIFGRLLEKDLWEEYAKNKTDVGTNKNLIIPLFISLPQISSPSKDVVKKALQLKGFSDEEIQLLKSQTFLFILDGFDEVSDKTPLIAQNDFKPNGWKGKIIITSRLGYLSQGEEVLFIQEPEKKDISKLKQCFIVPFSEQRINDYIKHYANNLLYNESGWSEGKYKEILEQFKDQGISELIKEPFLLQLILRVLPDLEQKLTIESSNIAYQEEKVKLTRFNIYEYFMIGWFKKEAKKLINMHKTYEYKEEEVIRIMQEYAENIGFELLLQNKQLIDLQADLPQKPDKLHLVDRQEQQIVYECEILAKGWTKFFESPSKQERRILKIGLKGCPVKKIGENRYMFIHKSFYEYFAARKITEEIRNVFDLDASLDVNMALNQRSLVEEFSVIGFINDILKIDDELERKFKFLSKKLEDIDTKKEFSNAIANLLAISNFEEYYLAYKIVKEIIDPPLDELLKNLDENMFLNKTLKNINLIIDFIKGILGEEINDFIEKIRATIKVISEITDKPSLIKMAYNIYEIMQSISSDINKEEDNYEQIISASFSYSQVSFSKFLELVSISEHTEAENIIRTNSGFLTLMSGNLKDCAGRDFKEITGLQYAIWSLDTAMWKMLLKYMPTQEADKQITLLKSSGVVKDYGLTFDLHDLIDDLEAADDIMTPEISGHQALLPASIVKEYKSNLHDWRVQDDQRLGEDFGWLGVLTPPEIQKKSPFIVLHNSKLDLEIFEEISPSETTELWLKTPARHDATKLTLLYENRLKELEKYTSIGHIATWKDRVANFLKLIGHGEQDQAEALLKLKPQLTCTHGDLIDCSLDSETREPRTWYNITAFQYAVLALDYHMWTMLLKYMDGKEIRAQLEELNSIATLTNEEGWIIKETTGAHKWPCASWAKLIAALDKYIENYDDNTWRQQVGGAQLILPAHVINEYSHPSRPFYPCPKWEDSEAALPRTGVSDWREADNGKYILGTGFAWCRWWRARKTFAGEPGGRDDDWLGVGEGAVVDCAAVSELLRARVEQARRLLLEPKLEINPKSHPRC